MNQEFGTPLPCCAEQDGSRRGNATDCAWQDTGLIKRSRFWILSLGAIPPWLFGGARSTFTSSHQAATDTIA
jgi:hypothetical protein